MIPQPLLEMRDGSTRLMDDVIGNGFGLISYGEHAAYTARDAARCDFGLEHIQTLAVSPSHLTIEPDPALHADTGRDIENRLGAFSQQGADCLFVIRPDRYIMSAAAISSKADLERLAAEVRGLKAGTQA